MLFRSRELGKYTEAETLQIQVLYARHKVLGEKHPHTISATSNLALTYRGLGKYAEAEKLQIKVLNVRNKILGEEHPDTISASSNLALTYRDLGKYTEAEELQIQVLHTTNKLLGGDHPDTIRATRTLAATQKATSESMMVDNSGHQPYSISDRVYMTQNMKGENVDVGVPHASTRLHGEDYSNVVEAPAHFPSIINVDNRMLPSEKKGI